MSPLRRVALAGGVTLAVSDNGPQDAPAILFLHGFPEDHRAWRAQVAHFSPRYRCIAPDQRGYGASDKPAAVADYALDRLAQDVLDLADALGIARFVLAGHDWGAMVAWRAAMRDAASGGGRITRLVIANGPHPALYARLLAEDPAQRAAAAYIATLRDPAHDGLVAARGLAPLLLRAFGPVDMMAGIAPEERARLMAQWADPETARAMLAWYRAADSRGAPAVPVTVPVEVLWGTEDAALVAANATALGPLAPNAQVRMIAGCGHFSPWQAPGAVNAALDSFLAEA